MEQAGYDHSGSLISTGSLKGMQDKFDKYARQDAFWIHQERNGKPGRRLPERH